MSKAITSTANESPSNEAGAQAFKLCSDYAAGFVEEIEGAPSADLESMDEDERAEYEASPAAAFVERALDMEKIISSSGHCIGARLCMTLGGPNLWIEVRAGFNAVEVACHWGSASRIVKARDVIGLHEYLEAAGIFEA